MKTWLKINQNKSYSEEALYFTTTGHISLLNYVPNRSWDLVGSSDGPLNISDRFKLYNDTYNTNQFELEIEIHRRPLYFMINTIFPCLILNVLNLMSFGLPFPSQIALGITTFLTYSVYSINTSNAIPMQSEVWFNAKIHLRFQYKIICFKFKVLPAITVYYMLSSLFTLTSFGWFLLETYFRSRIYLPDVLRMYAGLLKKIDELILATFHKAMLVKKVAVQEV